MRTRWILVLSLLALTWIPGMLRAADAPGCAPAATVAGSVTLANALPSAAAPAILSVPSWADVAPQTSAPQALQGIDGTPLFRANSCVGCTFSLCQRLHSCQGCCG